MDQLRVPYSGNRLPVHPGIEKHCEHPVWQTAVRLISNPAFDAAMLWYCRRMVEQSAFMWPANKIFAQKVRYITCYTLIGLSDLYEKQLGPAPTMTLLKSLVPGSARQVSDLIAGLRAGGFVLAEQNAEDRREMRLRPSPALVMEIARSPLAFVGAAAMLEPHQHLEALIADPQRVSGMIGQSMVSDQSIDMLFTPFETVVDFTGRDSGYLMLCALMGAHLAQVLGESWTLPLTYDAMAQRFRVSRQHVGNVLSIVTAPDLVTLQGGRILDVDPGLSTEFSWWGAGQMAHFTMLAR
ncbi:MarR family transcriptional regulator [Rhizobium sp. AQ_MP]|uniref:MarR family transcriptional regulator n=1 Tax=Rhizobium sp. AQ_MP TaxID=2761536 RepID=UPI001639C24F|nr:MarR family transcriptional regulator [Rhizobium sp. AQ_MP]MBC2771984.1 MarR family transcriptional regulator [Rhizobium sp. AQ_MP]